MSAPGSDRLLLVMAYHSRRELDRFQRILDHWDELVEMRTPFTLLLVRTIDEELRTDLPRIDLRRSEDASRPSLELVAEEFLEICRYVEDNLECRCWFWWEHDVLPVRKDCFDFFLRRWRAGTSIMGYRVRDRLWNMKNRINGVAFYSRTYWSHLKPHIRPSQAFDTWRTYTRRADGRSFVELNRWYALVHHEKHLYLTPSLRLVHGISDDTLFEDLVGGTRHHRRVSRPYRALRLHVRRALLNWQMR
ncbi:MAG TPA: hypothetical protein VEL28_13480 [Candidatus Binatia bacterium]|nr:hypothetical protein [Candidatus Binatia bacterium]